MPVVMSGMSEDRPLMLGDQNPHGEEAHRSENRIFWLMILANLAVAIFIFLLWGSRGATDLPEPGSADFEVYRERMQERVDGDKVTALRLTEFNRRWITSQIDPGREVFAVAGRWLALTAVGEEWRLVLMAPGGHRLDCWFDADQLGNLRAHEGDGEIIVRGVPAAFDGRDGLHFCRVARP